MFIRVHLRCALLAGGGLGRFQLKAHKAAHFFEFNRDQSLLRRLLRFLEAALPCEDLLQLLQLKRLTQGT